jgi:hypothetical protein
LNAEADRPISPHPNLVTASGLEALTDAMSQSRTAYEAAQQIQDATTFGGGSSTSAAVSALSSRVKATLTVTTFPSQGYRCRVGQRFEALIQGEPLLWRLSPERHRALCPVFSTRE